MAISRWGDQNTDTLPMNTDPGLQSGPVVADQGVNAFSVGWIDGSTVKLGFFTELGQPDPLQPTVVLTDGFYGSTTSPASVSDLQLSQGGFGLGMGMVWEESAAGLPTLLRMRYVAHVTGGPVGGEFAISANTSVDQHDAAISAFAKDSAAGRPLVDGFDIAWVEGAGGAHALGNVYLQRVGVQVDRVKNPVGGLVATGLDGVVGGVNDGQVLVTDNGRDPSVAGLFFGGANETVVTWIDADNNININIYDDAGTLITNGIGADPTNLNTLDAPLAVGGQQHVMGLAGGGFVVAWIATLDGDNSIAGRVFTPGAIAGSFTSSPLLLLDALEGANSITDFTLAPLWESGGFTLGWTAPHDPDGVGALAATEALFMRSYTAGGLALEVLGPAIFHQVRDASNMSMAGIVGDRIVAVYQDNATTGDPSNISAQILDTRLNGFGQPIVLNGPGLTLLGDPTLAINGRVLPDVLVGTIGQDFIDGGGNNDILDGALGDDTIVAGAGNDSIVGGGGNDTLLLSGRYTQDGDSTNDDYSITALGNDTFQVTDLRANGDGVDIVHGIENFVFQSSGTVLRPSDVLSAHVQVTPTAWGWTDIDANAAPNADGTPDVDGFVVNHAPTSRAGVQGNVSVADQVGEFVGVVWESADVPGANTRIRGQFYDVIGAFDAFHPDVVDLSDGAGIETNAVISSGGANSGWAVAWEERDSTADASRKIRTNFLGPVSLTATEFSVLDEGQTVDQHDAAIFGSFLDRTLASPDGGSVLPVGMNEGYNVVWVSTHLNGIDGSQPAGYGRIMLQRFEAPFDAVGNPGAPVAGGLDGIAGLNNIHNTMDAAVWVGDEDANGIGGMFGRNPSTSSLHTFEMGIVFIASNGAGGEKVVFRGYDDLGQLISFPNADDISGAFAVAAGTTAHIVSAGAVNFAIVWITPDATSPSGYTAMGTMLSSAGTGLNGQGFAFGAPAAPFILTQLPAGFNPANSNFQATGLSGEDSNDVVLSWNMTTVANGDDLMAQHIRVLLDPATGIAMSMAAEGDAVTVNAETAGNQSGGAIAGLLGDRFIAVYQDNNLGHTDGADIVGRIVDTRDAVNPDPIIGDFVQPGGRVLARRDVLVGTNGNDNIRGDISNIDGRTDYIYGGMGDDVIEGGPGIQGAGGLPEIIDGGEGNDTAVFTGRLQDYSISLNGDGSYEVIDLRPTSDANGNPLTHDGVDNLYSIENLRFLDLDNNGADARTIRLTSPANPPPRDPAYDGTPVAWSLDDTSAYKQITVDADPTPATAADARGGIAVTNLQDGAGLAWTRDGNQVWAISYDVTGRPDPVFLGANTQLTSGAFAGNAVSDIDVAMTGGLGMTAVWESDNAGDSSIHLAFASTNTHVALDPAAAVPGPGIPGGEIVVVGSDGAGVAVDPVVQGYEIVNAANDTLEIGFHVGYVMQNGALDTTSGDAYGALLVARYEIPVYDLLVNAAGLPILDANGQGQLATDAFGNLIPSTAATFGVGSETAPTSLGLDGLRGTADDNAPIAITDKGLFAANAVPSTAHVVQGRSLSMGSLHDGQLVVSYIGTDENVHLRVYLPAVNPTGDRATQGAGGVDVVATGVTTYSELTLPFATSLGAVAPGQGAITVSQQNGSFGVFWGASDGVGGVMIRGVIYSGGGSTWTPSPIITFATGLPAGVAFQVAPTGVTTAGLEAGFFVSWETASGVNGQRFDMAGASVGHQIAVGDPTAGVPFAHSASGIDDGRMIVGFANGANVLVQYLDNRQSGVELIGPRAGALANVIAGTVGDDAIDGRNRNDTLYGGLGDDFITMGADADIGYGGKGNDAIIGAGGQDQLFGEDGDDLLWGGLSGPAEPFNADLEASLAAAGVSAALIATNTGADVISGGEGVDTVSFEGEVGLFNIDLGSGIVTSDRGNTGAFVLEDVIGQMTTDAAGKAIFVFTGDVENATGGLGDDRLVGDGNDNVLSGREGSNFYNGDEGIDTAVLEGALAAFTFSRTGNVLALSSGLNVQRVVNTEFLQFADRRVSVADIFNVLSDGQSQSGATLTLPDANQAPTASDDAASVLQGGAVVIKALANDTDPDGGQTLAISKINGAPLGLNAVTVADGVVTLLSNGALLFRPNASFFGTTSFTYTASDGTGGVSDATITVTVAAAAATVNTGAALLSVTGVAAEHGVLVAVLGADPDGNGPAPSFQWYRDGQAIVGATANAHTLTLADIGSALTVRASYVDAKGNAEAVTSASTGIVVAVNDGASAVSIAGTAAEHQTLTAVVGVDPDGAGSPPTLQWLRNGAVIAGATSGAYTLVTADVGANISLQVSYTDGQGFAEVVTSAITAPVAATNDGQAPVSISGSAIEGQPLTASVGSDPDGGNGPLSYQWFRGATAITGATSATYTTVNADAGANISVRVNYRDGQGFVESVTSAATGPVAAVNSGQAPVTITGAARVGQVLTRAIGADPDGTGSVATTQWLRNGVAITGATNATYTLVAGDLGTTISVRVSYTDGQGFAETATTVAGVVGSTITGTAGADTLAGTAGADFIDALGGIDTITANAGNDTVAAGAGNDIIVATVNDGNDAYDGQASTGDTYTLAGTTADATVNLQLGTASSAQTGSDTLANIENVIGGSGNDTLTGKALENNTLTGGAGNDTLYGRGGANAGGAGDTLVGGTGDDTYIVDFTATITEVANEGADTVRTSLTSYTLSANVENLVYTGTGVTRFTGTGSTAANVITGGGGADTLDGAAGNDTLIGGAGNDTITGNTGADILIGGVGADTINTGAVDDNLADLIRYLGANEFGDTVTNFDATGTATQVDRVQFGGTLNAAYDDVTDNDVMAWATGNGVNGGNTIANMDTTFEGLILSGLNGEGVTRATLGTAATVAAEFNAEFAITAAVGQDALLVINDTDANSFAVWQWVQGAAGGNEIDANELTLIGTYTANATVTQATFDIIPGG